MPPTRMFPLPNNAQPLTLPRRHNHVPLTAGEHRYHVTAVVVVSGRGRVAGTDTTLDAFVQGEVGDEEVRWGGDEGGEGGVEEGVW
eukprot:CAMPEP_0182504838 /NCGR_PEP_ID=MMETSP1321-20130603/17962_1 /TAXON_ID=91990 /ORGANISM="Bolidomonas sp., Strain RCC1657" /LENGTH=85 /DNA_ID=CAMNT_0024710265 /DNA_START=176 /DNA_END=430 /DNA_ORIENTATION=+